MAIKQRVTCDKCGNEVDGGGYHLAIGQIHWTDQETVDEGMEACTRHRFHLCDDCARPLVQHLPYGAGLVVLPGLRDGDEQGGER